MLAEAKTVQILRKVMKKERKREVFEFCLWYHPDITENCKKTARYLRHIFRSPTFEEMLFKRLTLPSRHTLFLPQIFLFFQIINFFLQKTQFR